MITKLLPAQKPIPSLRIITYWTKIILAFAEHDEIQEDRADITFTE